MLAALFFPPTKTQPLPDTLAPSVALAGSKTDQETNVHDQERPARWTMRQAVSKPVLHDELAWELDALPTGETDCLANTANAAAAIDHALPDLNWAGCYFVRAHELVPGPFQGRPACSRTRLARACAVPRLPGVGRSWGGGRRGFSRPHRLRQTACVRAGPAAAKRYRLPARV